MGNVVCVNGFRNAGNGQCVAPCPEDKGLEFITEGNTYKCVYRQNRSLGFVLNPITASLQDPDPNKPPLTIDIIKQRNPNLYNSYKAEETRVNAEVAKLQDAISKDQKTMDAFKDLQTAENIRDTDPQGYQTARMRYYTLLKGETWRDEEKARLVKVEIEPLASRYKTDIETNLRQIQDQSATIDAAKGVKDKVLSIKDELQYSTSTFQKQLNNLKDAITMEYRKKQQQKESGISWIGLILNALIVILLITAIVVVARKYFLKTAYTSTPSTTINT